MPGRQSEQTFRFMLPCRTVTCMLLPNGGLVTPPLIQRTRCLRGEVLVLARLPRLALLPFDREDILEFRKSRQSVWWRDIGA